MTADLRDELIADATAIDPTGEAFFKRLTAGEYPRTRLAVLAERTGDLVLGFPAKLRKLEQICASEDARVLMRENLDQEVGRDREGVVHAERSHITLWRRFARAVDAREDGCGVHSSWLDELLENARWMEALAFFGLGVDLNVPRTYRIVLPALIEKYGFTAGEVEFFSVHTGADEEHGARAADIIARHVTTDAEREAVLTAARRGAAAWWYLYRAADREMRAKIGTGCA